MNLEQLLKEIEEKVKPYYIKEDGGPFDDIHDWWHMKRVYGAAKKMLEIEPRANKGEVLMAALLHDIGRSKGGEADHAEFSYEIAKEFMEEYRSALQENSIDLDKVLLMVKYHTIAHICPDKSIADALEFNMFTDADKIDMFGPSGALRVPIATAYKGEPTVYWAIDRIKEMAKDENFYFKSDAGRKIGQKYKDYLKKFSEDLAAQRQEFEN